MAKSWVAQPKGKKIRTKKGQDIYTKTLTITYIPGMAKSWVAQPKGKKIRTRHRHNNLNNNI